MSEITIKTQQELDALPTSGFTEYTRIYIQNDRTQGRIVVRQSWGNSSVVAWGNSSVEAWGNSSVVAWENSSVVAWGNSSVEAWGNSSVVAWENSSVVARENSSVEAWGNSSVEAWGNSSVEAWGNSSVEAWGNSSVVARENSSVVARENSSVVARENSSVVAWGNVAVRLASCDASVILYMFAVCWVLIKNLKKDKLTKKAKTATIIKPETSEGATGWLEGQGIKKDHSNVILFKRVSADLKTQEGTSNETLWEVGKTLDHPAWSPTMSECGAGKFHACSRPYFCDEFRSNTGDKYVAIKVNVKDLFAWTGGTYPHKIAFKKGTVLYLCDKYGKRLA